MTTAKLFDRVTTAQIQTQDLTDDQLEMVSGGAKMTCRRVYNPDGSWWTQCESIKITRS